MAIINNWRRGVMWYQPEIISCNRKKIGIVAGISASGESCENENTMWRRLAENNPAVIKGG